MEHKSCQVPESKLLQRLGNLRKMMVHHHHLENLSDFVLHDLCTGPCFEVNKAAYFINNPDFNLLRGVAGYHKQDLQGNLYDAWDNQSRFIATMQNSPFHQKVRNCHELRAFDKGQKSEKYMVDMLADRLEIEKPMYHVWNSKHENHGLLIYEPEADDEKHMQDHVVDTLYYLSFCPVY